MAVQKVKEHTLRSTFTYKLPAYILGLLTGLVLVKFASLLI